MALALVLPQPSYKKHHKDGIVLHAMLTVFLVMGLDRIVQTV